MSPEKFLKSKFGEDCRINCVGVYDKNKRSSFITDFITININLVELIEEYEELILNKENIKESFNPRSKEYVVVNTNKGTIIGNYKKSII